MFRHGLTAIIGMLASLGCGTALAGRGDWDPGYGDGGRLTAATAFYDPYIRPISDLVALNLPDDRLMTVEGTLVRRFDSEGRFDPTFGDNGSTYFPIPAATPFLTLLSNPVATPDGGLLLAALLRDDLGTTFFETLIRLDADGHLVTSFGGNGDGVYRLTTESIPEICGGICTELVGVAVDLDGRVMLAKRSWNAQGHCGGSSRVVRLTADGAVDAAFGANGVADITGVALCAGTLVFGARNDGSIVVGESGVVIGLDASGVRDATFGTAGQLSLASSVGWSSARLLPDGGLLLAGSRLAPSQPETVLARFNAAGQPDAVFGDGTGVVQQDFGQTFFGISGLQPLVSAMASTVDGAQLYLQISLTRSAGDAVCAGGIARLSGDGTIDPDFGEQGLTCLDYGAFSFRLIGLQLDGAPLFGQLDGNVYRLLLDATASPGFLTPARSLKTLEVGERDGSATISVVRTAGRDGAVSAHFYTQKAPRDPRNPSNTAYIAEPDSDYRTTTGQLEWADGEAGSHPISVEILDDLDQETREIFVVNIYDAQGGAQLCGVSWFIVGIDDDDSVVIDNDPPPADDSSSGGGGSVSWATPFALLTLLLIRRRRPCRAEVPMWGLRAVRTSQPASWPAPRATTAPSANYREERVMANHIARIASLPWLLLLVNTAAWAGRGDIDPNYGEGGQLAAPPGARLVLPGDRLVIADGGTGEGFRVRMVDAAGRNVPSFGASGVVVIDSLAAERGFSPDAAALAPNGDMIFAGSLSVTQVRGLLRLDSDGQPVVSFGDRGDGFIEPAVTTAHVLALAVDSDGRIVLADGSWEPGYDNCGSPARLQRLLADGQPDTGFGGGAIIEIPDLDICNGASVFGTRADGGVIVGDGHTIVAFDAAGDIDPTFGADGRLVVNELPSVRGLLLPDGGLLLVGSSDESTPSNDTVFLKFDRNGEPDLDFGSGTGSVSVDLGAGTLGEPSTRENVEQVALDPDGEHVFADLSVWHTDGSFACVGIARVTIDGTPDAGFGRNGLTCLNLTIALIAVQSDGAPFFYAEDVGSIHRLLPDNRPSPGFLRGVATRLSVDESAGTASLAVERLAGRDGAVSVNFATVDRRGSYVRYPGDHIFTLAESATAGSDYTATSGRLDWASGDDSPGTVTVRILADNIVESRESFGVDFSEPGGGALMMIAASSTIFIDSHDVTAPPPPPGGGGSTSWYAIAALAALAARARRRPRSSGRPG